MRFVYSVGEAFNDIQCLGCAHKLYGRGYCYNCGVWNVGVRSGPRMRLPQAKDVPEDVILRVLNRRPGVWHTHWRGDHIGMPSLPNISPELASFPEKVLFAKLKSMARRGLIGGGGSDHRCRGDWCVGRDGVPDAT